MLALTMYRVTRDKLSSLLLSFKMAGDPKILIIGAGAAGIAAASRLLEKGFQNVLILEAKNRIGGRIHTVKFGQ